MSVIINTNYSATVASNNLAVSNASLQKSLNRLSSGSKIVNPADDAGGLAVSMKLSAAATRQGAALSNIGNATSYLQTQDGALKVAGKVLDRISELKTLYVDPTKNTSDLANYNSEFTALQAQLTALATEKFNGVALFGTSDLSVATTEDASATSTVTSKAIDLLNGGASNIGQITGAADLNALNLTTITSAIQDVATDRAKNGAGQSRLGFASELLTTNKANLEAANSRIIDVDVAAESTQLARFNTLVQAGTSMLTQANQSAQTALKLLQ